MSDATKIDPPAEAVYVEAEARYRLLQPKYEKLATEVEYILQDALAKNNAAIIAGVIGAIIAIISLIVSLIALGK
jgi:hypothetical protein